MSHAKTAHPPTDIRSEFAIDLYNQIDNIYEDCATTRFAKIDLLDGYAGLQKVLNNRSPPEEYATFVLVISSHSLLYLIDKGTKDQQDFMFKYVRYVLTVYSPMVCNQMGMVTTFETIEEGLTKMNDPANRYYIPCAPTENSIHIFHMCIANNLTLENHEITNVIARVKTPKGDGTKQHIVQRVQSGGITSFQCQHKTPLHQIGELDDFVSLIMALHPFVRYCYTMDNELAGTIKHYRKNGDRAFEHLLSSIFGRRVEGEILTPNVLNLDSAGYGVYGIEQTQLANKRKYIKYGRCTSSFFVI